MGKKSITGKSTKLREGIQPGLSSKSLYLITPKKKSIAKTYRLKETDLKHLREISNAVNKDSTTHISDTSLIRTLIFIGTQTKPEKIIKAFRKII